MTDGYNPDFLIGFYRKPKYPWETSVRPAIVIHFYELPDYAPRERRKHERPKENTVKMKSPVLIIALAIMALCAGIQMAYSQTLQWQVPNFGLINLNIKTSEALVAYDGINKVALAGASLPVYTDPKGLIALQIGAVAPWQSNEASVQPYIAIGHDIAKEIPILQQFNSFHINLIGRYDSGNGRAGAGIGASYSFAE